MSKFIKILQTYLMIGLPFIVVTMIWGKLGNAEDSQKPWVQSILWEILSWNLMLWFALLIVFLIFLVFFKPAQEQTLKRVANIKEQDEREEYITGRASRGALISTLSILILLLFLSIFRLDIRQLPPEKAVAGKSGTLSIGLGFKMFDDPILEKTEEGKIWFQSKDLLLSKTGIILLIMIWQMTSYHLIARRELGK